MTDKMKLKLLYETLKCISKDFMTSDQLRAKSKKMYGLEYEEALESSYDNMQELAAQAIEDMEI